MASRGKRSSKKRRRGRKRPDYINEYLPTVGELRGLPLRASVCIAAIATANALKEYSGEYSEVAHKAVDFSLAWCRGVFEWSDFSSFTLEDETEMLSEALHPSLISAYKLVETTYFAEYADERAFDSARDALSHAAKANKSQCKLLNETYIQLAMLYSVPTTNDALGGFIDPLILSFIDTHSGESEPGIPLAGTIG